MKSIKLKLVTFLLVLSTFGTLTAVASEPVDNNIEYKSVMDCNKLIGELVTSIIDNNVEFLYNNVSLFESDCYESLKHYLLTNNISSGKFTISDIVVDVTYPENSSTGDMVIMANTKIWCGDNQYNKLYLFEFHVNAIGDIYGFNVWVY